MGFACQGANQFILKRRSPQRVGLDLRASPALMDSGPSLSYGYELWMRIGEGEESSDDVKAKVFEGSGH
jgi:hypothetical protein